MRYHGINPNSYENYGECYEMTCQIWYMNPYNTDWTALKDAFDKTTVPMDVIEKSYVKIADVDACGEIHLGQIFHDFQLWIGGLATGVKKPNIPGRSEYFAIGDLVIVGCQGFCCAPSGWWLFTIVSPACKA